MMEEKFKSLKDLFDNLKMELARLRAEFEGHKNKDFVLLEQRVTALEKRITQLLQQIASMGSGHNNVSSGIDAGALAEIERRLSDLEDKFN
jgi:predicted  nucleic acid-binding Zn-ribbon protein